MRNDKSGVVRMSALSSRLALVFAAMAVPGLPGAHAADQAANWAAACEQPEQGWQCARPYAEGLAAFRAGPHGDESGGRWGFVDRDGNVAIPPRFFATGPFRHGLAAAATGPAQWGYVDTTGAWVIKPVLRRATPFNAAGTAIVQNGEGHLQIIGRDGRLVRALPREAWLADEGYGGGELASLRVPSAPALWRVAQRKRVRLPAGAAAVEGIGRDWLLVRPERRGAQPTWGYARADGGWEVAPGVLVSERAPLREGETVAVYRDGGWRFVGLDGKPLDEAVHASVERIASGAWLVRDQVGVWQVMDAARAPVARLGARVQRHGEGSWRVLQGEAEAWLVGPRAKVRKLADGAVTVRADADLLWVFGAADADADARPGPLLALIDAASGRDRLDDAGRAALAPYRVEVLPVASRAGAAESAGGAARAPGIVALLHPATPAPAAAENPGASTSPPSAAMAPSAPSALLSGDGRVLTGPQWRRVQPAGAPGLARVVLENGLTGVVDGAGQWRLPPEFQQIDAFDEGLALARLPRENGALRALVVSSAGERFEVPTRVLEQAVRLAQGHIVYAEQGEGGVRTGLWDVRAQRIHMEPRALEVEDFADGYALARDAAGWGVIDTSGAWRIAPATIGESRPRRLGGALFVGVVNADGDTWYRLFNAASGTALQELLNREPTPVGEGLWLLTLRVGGVLIVDAQGHVLLRERRVPQSVRRDGDWVVLAFEDRYGAVDGQGEWRIQPDYAAALRFVDPLGYASVYSDGRHALLDRDGRELLTQFPGAQPIPGMMRLAWSRAYAKETLLLAPDGSRVAALPEPNALDIGAGANGWVPYREDGRLGFLDADGRQVMGAHFDQLGPWRDDRAYARRRDVSGPLLGYIDATGRYAIKPRFTWAQSFAQERAWVIERGVLSLIDRDGRVLLRSLDRCGERVLVDANGAPRWPTELPVCEAGAPTTRKTGQ